MRIKRFDISSDLLKLLFDGEEKHFKVIEGALPDDAVLIRVWVDPYQSTPNMLSLFYVSTEFPDLKDGMQIQTEKVILERLPGEDLQ